MCRRCEKALTLKILMVRWLDGPIPYRVRYDSTGLMSDLVLHTDY